MAALSVPLPLTLAGDPGTHAEYIAGTHTATGRILNVAGYEYLLVSSAVAVCQQSFKHPLAPVALDSPAIGGACALKLPTKTVSVIVNDSTWGRIPYEYQAVNITGERCGLYGVAASGARVSFASNCTHVYVWPNFQATYGTIDVLAAS